MAHWLMKSEPTTFSIEDLRNKPKQTHYWDGVRNYQARNMMRDEMKVGDLAFFYHSNCPSPGIVGIVEVARASYPDFTAFDPTSPYFDPKSSPEHPRWQMVDVRYKEQFRHKVTLEAIKQEPLLATMRIVQRGNRLSITPVTSLEWDRILELAEEHS